MMTSNISIANNTWIENASGGGGNDTLSGNDRANVLFGLAGNDTLNGGAGADRMLGGLGHDTYVVDNSGDVVEESGGDGTDTVQAAISFSLADSVHAIGEIENLTLLGSAAINGTGNALDNVLIGNAGNNHAGRSCRRRPRWTAARASTQRAMRPRAPASASA